MSIPQIVSTVVHLKDLKGWKDTWSDKGIPRVRCHTLGDLICERKKARDSKAL